MAKKKETVKEKSKSFALFDDTTEVAPATKKSKVKESKAPASSKKVVTKKEEKKNDTKSKSTNTKSNTSRSKSTSASNSNSSSSKNKKETKETGRSKQARTSDTKQKPKGVKRSSDNDRDVSVKAKVKSKSNSKLLKEHSDKYKKSSRKSSVEVAGNRETVETDTRDKQKSSSRDEEVFKQATKVKRKERTNTVLAPRQIQAGPKKLKDEFLVGIVVDGEYLEVSPWSVKNGIYHQGFDSNFLVKYLHYEAPVTKYDAIDKK